MENLYIIFKGFLDPLFIVFILLLIAFLSAWQEARKNPPQTKSLYKTIIALKEIVAQLR